MNDRTAAQRPERTARTARTARPARTGRARTATVRRYLPPQHGAWAMLLLPYLVGIACTHAVWLHLPLLIAWLGGYLFSYYALLAAKTRRPARVAAQLRLYAAIAVPAALVVIAWRPRVLLFGPAFALLLAVNLAAARRHADRALVAGLASVVEGCLLVPVAAVVAGADVAPAWTPAAVLAAYFTGSLLFVKTMIRNRGDRRYRWASVGFHAVATVAIGVLAWPLGVVFAWLTVRAAWLPRKALAPKQVGLIELVNSLALLALVPATLR